jgi:hypothetical protein
MTVRIGRSLRGGSGSPRPCGRGATLLRVKVYCWLPLPTSANGGVAGSVIRKFEIGIRKAQNRVKAPTLDGLNFPKVDRCRHLIASKEILALCDLCC